MKLPRKWAKVGYGLVLAGVTGILLILFKLSALDTAIGWEEKVVLALMVLFCAVSITGSVIVRFCIKCPQCGESTRLRWPWTDRAHDPHWFCSKCGASLYYDTSENEREKHK